MKHPLRCWRIGVGSQKCSRRFRVIMGLKSPYPMTSLKEVRQLLTNPSRLGDTHPGCLEACGSNLFSHKCRYVNAGLYYLRQLFFATFDIKVHNDKGKHVFKKITTTTSTLPPLSSNESPAFQSFWLTRLIFLLGNRRDRLYSCGMICARRSR